MSQRTGHAFQVSDARQHQLGRQVDDTELIFTTVDHNSLKRHLPMRPFFTDQPFYPFTDRSRLHGSIAHVIFCAIYLRLFCGSEAVCWYFQNKLDRIRINLFVQIRNRRLMTVVTKDFTHELKKHIRIKMFSTPRQCCLTMNLQLPSNHA